MTDAHDRRRALDTHRRLHIARRTLDLNLGEILHLIHTNDPEGRAWPGGTNGGRHSIGDAPSPTFNAAVQHEHCDTRPCPTCTSDRHHAAALDGLEKALDAIAKAAPHISYVLANLPDTQRRPRCRQCWEPCDPERLRDGLDPKCYQRQQRNKKAG